MRVIGVFVFSFFIVFNGQGTGQGLVLNQVSPGNFKNSVPADKQFLHYAPTEVSDEYRKILNKIISVKVVDAPMDETLKEIAALANIHIAFSKDVAEDEWKKPVSIHYEQATVLGAMYATLGGSGLRLTLTTPTGKGRLIVVNGSVSDFASGQNEDFNRKSNRDNGFGVITGEVRDAETGVTLPGANVLIKGTLIGVSTDIDGRYTLRRVPAGNQVLEVSYIGYETGEIPVIVTRDERIVEDVSLVSALVEGDVIFVIGRQLGQARALTRQRESINVRSVVSAEQMDRFADQTVEGSLQRIAGMGHGGANIRGVGPAASNITMDGQRMGSTGTGERSVDVGTISSDMVQELEVIKVITPDMDADALSGVVNISTRRPVGAERMVNVRLGGGTTSRYGELTGPSRRFSISYGDSPQNNFTYGINFGYQRDTPGSEWLLTDWGIQNFGDGPVDVLTDYRYGMNFGKSDRYSVSLQMTFQPTERTTYHVQGMFNYQHRLTYDHEYRYDMDLRRYINRFETGRITDRDFRSSYAMIYGTELTDQEINQNTVQVGARHLFDRFDLEYSLGWGHGRFYRNRYGLDLSTTTGYDWLIDYSDRWHPTIEISPRSRLTNNPDAYDYSADQYDHRWDNHIDNEFRGSIDLEGPFRLGSFKFGSSGLFTIKDGRPERFRNNYNQLVRLQQLRKITRTNWSVFEREEQSYQMPWILDLDAVRKWYENNSTDFQPDINSWAEVAEGDVYTANEFTFGIYGMTTFEFGRLKLLSGLRGEFAGNNYKGREGIIDFGGSWMGASDIESSNRYFHLFPNVQIVYGLGARSNIRLAYSRSIGRPSFSELSPSTIFDYQAERITRGNPDLKPMLSNNIDLLLEHYFMNIGQISVGLYYKELSDFSYRITRRIGDEGIDGSGAGEENGQGMFAGWQLREYRSGEKAMVYGLEISWQQHLDFLPGFLGNFSTYANYAYAYSEAEVDRPESARLVGQRPHVVNTGVDYSQGSFSGQISYHWGSPSISSYASDPRWVPEIQLRERVWFDMYRDAANDLSLTLRYRLTSSFRIWLDASNILNHRSVSYNYHRDFYPRTARLSGRTMSIGVRYSL